MRCRLKPLSGHSHRVQNSRLSVHRVAEDLHFQNFGVSLERDIADMLCRGIEFLLADLRSSHRSCPRVIEEPKTGILTGRIDL